MGKYLDHEKLVTILETNDIESVSFEHIEDLILHETGIDEFKPDGLAQIDPRNGELILYNTARARRPHDNIPVGEGKIYAAPRKKCAICEGETTGILDVALLSEGFTFINKNLYPVLFPSDSPEPLLPDYEETIGPLGLKANGLHLLQWTSSFHDKDWHNMPRSDRMVVMERLAALERVLLTQSKDKMPSVPSEPGREQFHGYVSIFKNFGRLVGGSLAHGHQQIAFSNLMPKRVSNNWRFQKERGETFASYILRENPSDFLIRDYRFARLLVPYFMRRPYDMCLVLEDTSKAYLHELTRDELGAVVDGWHDAILVMLMIMPQIGREPAYNVIMNSGPGAGLYFEFLPYTQEIGGMEHLGLFLCQGNPLDTATQIRKVMAEQFNHANGGQR